MQIRDSRLLAEVASRPFTGYARRDSVVIAPVADRVLACCALLITMVVSGILLGSPRRDDLD